MSIPAIYGLLDPVTGKLKYVGQSIHPDQRVQEHLRAPAEALKGWLYYLKTLRREPRLVILEQISYPQDGDLDRLEQWWIHWAIRKNQPLLNTQLIPSYYRELHRILEPCPWCGMFCGWTLRGKCGFQENDELTIVSVEHRDRHHNLTKGQFIGAYCHMCGHVGPIKKADYRHGGYPVVKCSYCGRWYCRACYCNCRWDATKQEYV